jgi:class 3 adenylate cyclase
LRSTTPARGSPSKAIAAAIVKTTGDGLFAAFDDPVDAVKATLMFQQSLVDPAVTNGIAIRVRCGLHMGSVERRDNDYFGTPSIARPAS